MPPACFLNAPTQKDNQKPRFLDFLHAVPFTNLTPYTTRSQKIAVIAAYDELTFVLRRCRSRSQR